ncbi:hypothetical protein QFC21_001217 [Naganishia friedmannii]|uniref:Uncharacterized protein n=1 Tax=Naganishia friedmannii TaxID=89922 RepID=A0ACC2W3P6_9TREE|nr:hypothetical protein QFC21_001217 [Naganishia friedmannii]
MPKAPTNPTKPQAAVAGRKPAKKGKKNGTKKAVIAPGRPRVQVSFDSKDAEKTNGFPFKGKGRANDDEDDAELSGDEDITMTGAEVKDDDDEDQKPDISKLTNSGAGPKKRVATQNEKFLVIAGSYEKNMYGLEIDVKNYKSSSPETSPPLVKPIFIFPAHLSCIKTMKASPGGGKFLATGSDDEFVKVWDLRRRKEIGSLSQHIGSITSVAFPTRSHLLSASEDATISLFRTRDWALLRSLKGHSGRVNCIDVHPSGKVALSVGKDKTLKMWDLMRGRGAASLALGAEADVVRFAPDGNHFGILLPTGIDVYTTRMVKVGSISSNRRLHDIVFVKIEEAEFLLTGTEEGKLLVYRLDLSRESIENETACQSLGALRGHSNRYVAISPYSDDSADSSVFASRIKAVSHMRMNLDDGPVDFVTTVSSDGKINIHDFTRASQILQSRTSIEGEDISPVASYDTKGSRLVCCCTAEVFRGKSWVQVKGEVKDEGEVKNEDGSDDEDHEFYEPSGELESGGEEEEIEIEDEDEHEMEED